MNAYHDMKDLTLLMSKIDDLEAFLTGEHFLSSARDGIGSVVVVNNGFGLSYGINESFLTKEENEKLVSISINALKRELIHYKKNRVDLIKKFNDTFDQYSKEEPIIVDNAPYKDFITKLEEIN